MISCLGLPLGRKVGIKSNANIVQQEARVRILSGILWEALGVYSQISVLAARIFP